MDTSFILIALLAFAFGATHLERRFLGERVLLFAGVEYLLIGLLAGPLVLNILAPEHLGNLESLLSVIEGFFGFSIGLAFRFSHLREFPSGVSRFALIAGGVVTLIVGGGAFAAMHLLPAFDRASVTDIIAGSVTLGVGAAMASEAAIRKAVTQTRAVGPVSSDMPRVAFLISVTGIVVFGVVVSAGRALPAASIFDAITAPETLTLSHNALGLGLVEWALVALGAGIGIGLIFYVFVGKESDIRPLFVATIGVLALVAGVADMLSFSAIFIGLLVGATYANLADAGQLRKASRSLRDPFRVLLLMIIGALWVPLPASLWALPPAFIALRIISLRVGAKVAVRAHREFDRHTPVLGDALLGQGALAAAIAVDFAHARGGLVGLFVVTCLILSTAVNELWAGRGIRRVLQNAGETGRLAPGTEPAVRPVAFDDDDSLDAEQGADDHHHDDHDPEPEEAH